MDIEIFGAKFSKFIVAFKRAYQLSDNTYDYMSFLEITDCASHCAMIQTYNNPNNVLNNFITPLLNTIQVIGGKKIKMKGGANQNYYLSILILFGLALSNAFAGPARNRIEREFGTSQRAWPSHPGNTPELKYFGLLEFWFQEIPAYQNSLAEYERFLPLFNDYKIEYETEQQIAQTEAQTLRIQAEEKLALAESKRIYEEKEKQEEINKGAAFYKLLEALEQNTELAARAAFYQGVFYTLAFGGALGFIYYMTRSRGNPQVIYSYQSHPQTRQSQQPRQRLGQASSYGVDENGNPIISRSMRRTNPVLMQGNEIGYRGGEKKKTRKHKKTTNKKHNRKSRR